MSLSKSDSTYSSQIETELRKRFSQNIVEFRVGYDTEAINLPKKQYSERFPCISIYDHRISVSVLKDLGSSIQILSIRNESMEKPQKLDTIFNLIEEHCTETVKKLNLMALQQNFFKNLTKPFKNVKEMELVLSTVGSDKMSFADLFPSLRGLWISSIEIEIISSVVVNYPHLENLAVAVDRSGNSRGMTEEATIDLLHRNQQIQKLALTYLTPNILKFAADHLPHLNKIKIDSYMEQNEYNSSIHFENVKIAKICHSMPCKWPAHLTFSNKLEELQTQLTFPTNEFIGAIENGKNLKKLTIDGRGVNNYVVSRFTNAKLNATEMVLSLTCDVEAIGIIEFIKSAEKLRKLQLTPCTSVNDSHLLEILPMIGKHFDDEWVITVSQSNFKKINKILMEKKYSKKFI